MNRSKPHDETSGIDLPEVNPCPATQRHSFPNVSTSFISALLNEHAPPDLDEPNWKTELAYCLAHWEQMNARVRRILASLDEPPGSDLRKHLSQEAFEALRMNTLVTLQASGAPDDIKQKALRHYQEVSGDNPPEAAPRPTKQLHFVPDSIVAAQHVLAGKIPPSTLDVPCLHDIPDWADELSEVEACRSEGRCEYVHIPENKSVNPEDWTAALEDRDRQVTSSAIDGAIKEAFALYSRIDALGVRNINLLTSFRGAILDEIRELVKEWEWNAAESNTLENSQGGKK